MAHVRELQKMGTQQCTGSFVVPDKIVDGVDLRHTRNKNATAIHSTMQVFGAIYIETVGGNELLKLVKFLICCASEVPGGKFKILIRLGLECADLAEL